MARTATRILAPSKCSLSSLRYGLDAMGSEVRFASKADWSEMVAFTCSENITPVTHPAMRWRHSVGRQVNDLMNVCYPIGCRFAVDQLHIYINNEAFLVDIVIGFPHLVFDALFGQIRRIDQGQVTR